MRHEFGTYMVLVAALLLVSGCATVRGHWRRAQHLNTVGGYEEFIRRWRMDSDSPPYVYVHHTYYGEARVADSLATEARARIDGIVYEQSRTLNSIAAYEDYLRRFPYGSHSDDVRTAIERMCFAEAKKRNTTTSFADFLSKYPTGNHGDVFADSALRLQKKLGERRATLVLRGFLPLIRNLRVEGSFSLAPNYLGQRVVTGSVTVLRDTVVSKQDARNLLGWSHDPTDLDSLIIPKGAKLRATPEHAGGFVFSYWMANGGKTVTDCELSLGESGTWLAGAAHEISGWMVKNGYTFYGDEQNPLVFTVVSGQGYVYKRGRGTVLTPEHKLYVLGEDGAE